MPHISALGAAMYTQFFVGPAGENDPANMLEVPGLRGEPAIGTEASTSDLPGFGRGVQLKIPVQGTLPSFEFEANLQFALPIHQALILSSGISDGDGVRSAADPDAPNQIVLDANGDFVPAGAPAATDFVFASRREYGWVMVFRIEESGENSYFYFDGTVAGGTFAPNTQDNSLLTGELALTTVPKGPLTLPS